MTESRFLKKYESKSDNELKRIINDKETYLEQARIAAIEILKKRQGLTETLKNAENEIKENQIDRTKQEIKSQPPFKKATYITDDPSAPKLYTKKLIYIFSVIFSPLFGSILMMRNFKETGHNIAKFQVLAFGILYTSVIAWGLLSLETKYNLSFGFNIIGAGILSEFFWNKKLGKEIKHRKRSWIIPTIIGVIITVGLVALNILGR